MERKTLENSKEARDHAVLVGLRSPVLGDDSADEESLMELSELVDTAGGDTAGIVGGFFDGLIAGDRGDPADIQKRAGLGQHPCDGVIVAGVAIQQNRQLLKVVHR